MNKSFAIKTHVRQVVDMVSSTDVAADGDGWPSMLTPNVTMFCQITTIFSSKVFVGAIAFHHIKRFIVDDDHIWGIHLLRGDFFRFGKFNSNPTLPNSAA